MLLPFVICCSRYRLLFLSAAGHGWEIVFVVSLDELENLIYCFFEVGSQTEGRFNAGPNIPTLQARDRRAVQAEIIRQLGL